MRRTLFLLALLQLSMTVAFSPVAPLTVKRQVSNVAWSGKPAAFVHPVLHNSLRPQFSLRRTRQVIDFVSVFTSSSLCTCIPNCMTWGPDTGTWLAGACARGED
jgi:hypothetical protein